jgi:hypothetical protein
MDSDTHFVVTIDVKKVTKTPGVGQPNNREVTDELHLTKRTTEIHSSLEWAVHVLTTERNLTTQNQNVDQERLDKARKTVLRQLQGRAGTGVTASDLDSLSRDIVENLLGGAPR